MSGRRADRAEAPRLLLCCAGGRGGGEEVGGGLRRWPPAVGAVPSVCPGPWWLGREPLSGVAVLSFRWPSEAVTWRRGGSMGAGDTEPLTAEQGRARITAARARNTQSPGLRKAPRAGTPLPACEHG